MLNSDQFERDRAVVERGIEHDLRVVMADVMNQFIVTRVIELAKMVYAQGYKEGANSEGAKASIRNINDR
mgnify:CR=1 FL=1